MNNTLKKKVTLPVGPVDLSLFIAHLHAKHLRYSTIQTYLSALDFVHKMQSFKDPLSSFLVCKTLKGIKNLQKYKSTNLKLVTKDILVKVLHYIPFCTDSFYNRIMYKALFLIKLIMLV